MWDWILKIAALLGIGGISLTQVISDDKKSWIALGAFLLLLLYVGYRLIRTISKRLDAKYPKGYLPISTIARMATTDGKNLVYETTRHIQVKRPTMRHFEHRFFWTGTKDPRVTSSLQMPSKIDCIDGEKTKLVKLKFPMTRVYDEVEVIHVRMDIDDSDQQSATYVSHTVDAPVTLISWRIELPYVTDRYFGSKASIYRTAINHQGHPAEERLETVVFDAVAKSFSFDLTHPEPGYRYTLAWPRP